MMENYLPWNSIKKHGVIDTTNDELYLTHVVVSGFIIYIDLTSI
jgi:hypothetical protein